MTRLLVAEDDADIRMLVANVLSKAGYQTEAVDGGRAALDAYRRSAPAVLVLDVNMPDVTGLEVCTTVKSERDGDLKVLLMSAKSTDADVAAGFAAGADDYLAKPFSPRELVRRIEVLVKRGATGPA